MSEDATPIVVVMETLENGNAYRAVRQRQEAWMGSRAVDALKVLAGLGSARRQRCAVYLIPLHVIERCSCLT